MNIELVKLSRRYKAQFFDMMEEWTKDIAERNTNRSPRALFRNDFHDFDYYLEHLEIKTETADGLVPDTVLFCLDTDKNIFIGAVDIRHSLNAGLLRTGGHIGDGIRPSQRHKGFATAMIALALKECKKLGIERVLMTCDKTNIASAKSILKNGGVFENEIWDEGVVEQRFWIDLRKINISRCRLWETKPSARIKKIGNAEDPVVQSPYIEKSFPKYTSRASGEAKISSREP